MAIKCRASAKRQFQMWILEVFFFTRCSFVAAWVSSFCDFSCWPSTNCVPESAFGTCMPEPCPIWFPRLPTCWMPALSEKVQLGSGFLILVFFHGGRKWGIVTDSILARRTYGPKWYKINLDYQRKFREKTSELLQILPLKAENVAKRFVINLGVRICAHECTHKFTIVPAYYLAKSQSKNRFGIISGARFFVFNSNPTLRTTSEV